MEGCYDGGIPSIMPHLPLVSGPVRLLEILRKTNFRLPQGFIPGTEPKRRIRVVTMPLLFLHQVSFNFCAS
jgi:hypothetical protein